MSVTSAGTLARQRGTTFVIRVRSGFYRSAVIGRSCFESIRALPGIGDYTAAAVASIAFRLPHAAVDGNALRVLSRLAAELGDIGARKTRERLEAEANVLLDRKRPGDFNQAIMELGATICLTKSPDCPRCPLPVWRSMASGHRSTDAG